MGAKLGLGLLLVAGLTPAAAEAVSAACRLSLTARADAASFSAAGHQAGPERLARLSAATRERFTAAAKRLCAAGLLRPADLARFGELVVQNGEGATEPILYRDEAMGRRSFVFQFAFQDGGPPEPAAFEQALRCWKRPQSSVCDPGD